LGAALDVRQVETAFPGRSKGVYGAAETVNSIGSKDLEKAPEVAAFLKKFQWASRMKSAKSCWRSKRRQA
jgi:ABC-type proline/glycine betaine transport system substrate-binding protein